MPNAHRSLQLRCSPGQHVGLLLLHLEVSPSPSWPGGQVADVMAVAFVAMGVFVSELVRPLELTAVVVLGEEELQEHL